MSDTPTRAEHQFELLGGRLCLDFANTVSGIREWEPRDRLLDYAGLVSWARQVGTATEAQARRLLAEARRRPADAEVAFRDAIALREAIYSTFLAFAQDREPRAADLSAVNAALGRALSHRRIQ